MRNLNFTLFNGKVENPYACNLPKTQFCAVVSVPFVCIFCALSNDAYFAISEKIGFFQQRVPPMASDFRKIEFLKYSLFERAQKME